MRYRAWLCTAVVKDRVAMGIKEEVKRTRGGNEVQTTVAVCLRKSGQPVSVPTATLSLVDDCIKT